MDITTTSQALASSEKRLLTLFALFAGAFFYLPGLLGSYGFFIDELYYAACAAHPALGYVDHPPLAPWLLAVVRALLGDSLWAIRLLPALMGALSVTMTMLLARRLGAGPFGQALAGGALIAGSIMQLMFGTFSMNTFSPLIWLGCCWILLEIEARNEPRLWLAFGALAGIGLLNKHTIVLLAFALGLALVLTPARRHLAGKWLWAGAGLALLIASPNLIWQMAHDWPSIEFYRNANLYKNLETPPHMVAMFQVLTMNLGTLPIWLAGLYFFLRARQAKPWRHLGVIFVVLFLLLMASRSSRPDRITAIYPLLFAAGGMWLERITRKRNWARWALALFLIINGLVFLPIGTPILPPDALATYVAKLGVVPKIESGEGKTSAIPQWYADRTGWEELVVDVKEAVASLSPSERAKAAIFAPSYGQAGALQLLGKEADLPPVHSAHNTYFLWGPPAEPITAAVVIGDRKDHLDALFEEVTLFSTHHCTYCMRWRDEMPIWVVRRPIGDLASVSIPTKLGTQSSETGQ